MLFTCILHVVLTNTFKISLQAPSTIKKGDHRKTILYICGSSVLELWRVYLNLYNGASSEWTVQWIIFCFSEQLITHILFIFFRFGRVDCAALKDQLGTLCEESSTITPPIPAKKLETVYCTAAIHCRHLNTKISECFGCQSEADSNSYWWKQNTQSTSRYTFIHIPSNAMDAYTRKEEKIAWIWIDKIPTERVRLATGLRHVTCSIEARVWNQNISASTSSQHLAAKVSQL